MQELSCKSKSYKATVWMCDTFPLPVSSIGRLLTVLAPTSKHVSRLNDFLTHRLPQGFPVKLDIPLFPTVTARATFTACSLDSVPLDVFTVPSHYQVRVCALTLSLALITLAHTPSLALTHMQEIKETREHRAVSVTSRGGQDD